MTATPAAGYQFINWTENEEAVSTDAEYSFTVTAARDLVANFELLTYEITAVANPVDGGSIIGAGTYTHGETATLTATPTFGYQFIRWTENGEAVSTDAEYSFTVTNNRNLVADFYYVQNRDLAPGWNWFSSCIEIEGSEGLEMIENALGEDGLQIKTQTEFVSYYNGAWYGSLMVANVQDMFMIQTATTRAISLEGNKVNPEEYPFSIGTDWRWLSYPVSANLTVNEALATMTPQTGDYVKSKTAFSQYYEGIGWLGALNIMMPGEGYMYQNTSGMTKTLVYPAASASKSATENVTAEENNWIPEAGRFATNMSVTAVVMMNGRELEGGYEVAAFVGDEVRGSARPIYIEALDRHIAFMTVYGNRNEEFTFRCFDIATGEVDAVSANVNIVFSDNATYGSIDEAVVLTRGALGIDENDAENINLYPNPAAVNSEIRLGMTYDKVEVYNSIGVMVAEYLNVDKIDGMETAGVYMIRLTNNNMTVNSRIIVR